MEISGIYYNPAMAESIELSGIDELAQCRTDSVISWISITGLSDHESIRRLGDLFQIHPLTIEDVLDSDQQSKIETFDNYKFMSVKTVQLENKFHQIIEERNRSRRKKDPVPLPDEFRINQVSMIIMDNVLFTFQEQSGNSFDRVKKRIMGDMGKIRRMGTDYLAYEIIDSVVDEYFLTLGHLEDDIENIEERAAGTTDNTYIREIQKTKRYLLNIKHAIAPLRENMGKILHQESFFYSDELKPFLQDLNENLGSAIVTVDNHREWLTYIMDVNLSMLSYQMNKVMKVLATISTIFIPLTFIAGVYGMNFEFMPELGLQFAYPIVLLGMGIIALTMIVFFKIRRWF